MMTCQRSAAALFLFCMLATLGLANDAQDKPAEADQDVQQWLEQLGDSSFQAREGASDQLFRAGARAVTGQASPSQRFDLALANHLWFHVILLGHKIPP